MYHCTRTSTFRNMNIRNTRSLDPGTCILWSGHNHLCVQEMTTKWARTTSHKWSYNPAINGLINGFSWGYNPTGIMSSYGKYLDSGPTFWPSKTTIQVEHHRVKTFRIPFFYTTLPPACEKLTRKSKHGASKCSEGFFCLKACLFPKDLRYTLRKGFTIYMPILGMGLDPSILF